MLIKLDFKKPNAVIYYNKQSFLTYEMFYDCCKIKESLLGERFIFKFYNKDRQLLKAIVVSEEAKEKMSSILNSRVVEVYNSELVYMDTNYTGTFVTY